MMKELKKCPICPRSCDLSEPHCERGKEYARTGMMPEASSKNHPHRLHFEKKEQQLIMKYLHHAVGVADRGGINQEMAKKMFDILSEEETVLLAQLLEKLSDYWISIAPNKPSHH